jgi:putative methyltransferase (TIGR04325 family)
VFKKILELIAPLWLYKFIRKSFSIRTKGRFNSYYEAVKACTGLGYNDPDLIELVIKKANALKKSFSEMSIEQLSSSQKSLLLFLSTSKIKNIIEFGGGSGFDKNIYHYLLGLNYNFSWRIVENKSFCEISQEKGLLYYESIENAMLTDKLGPTLFYANASLQYTVEPIAMLIEIIEFSFDYLVLFRIPLSKIENNFWTIQKSKFSSNGPQILESNDMIDKKVEYPLSVISKKQFDEVLSDNYVTIEFPLDEYLIAGEKVRFYNYYCIKRSLFKVV